VFSDTVIVGCAPFEAFGHVKQLYALGVRGVVNLCDEYRGPVDAYSNMNIRQLWLRTVDHAEPSLEHMQNAVHFIQQYKEKGEKVYVHCKAGHGRSAAIALCWLMKENPSATAKALNEQMLRKRHVRKRLYTQQQVRAFKRALQDPQQQQ
jgi:atypical dual specificity phosphatase